MFIGHFAPALIAAAHKDAPRLPVLFIAAQLVDWAFFGLLLTGAEAMRIIPGFTKLSPLDLYHMPYTHSLLGAVAFGLAMGGLIWLVTRNRNAGLIAGAVVVSHWFLDWLVHIPDLTITGYAPKFGLGLWNYPAIEIPLELVLIFGSLCYYSRKSGAKGAPLWCFAGLLGVLQLYSWFGPMEAEVTIGTSLLALTAYGVVTFAAYCLERSGLAGTRAAG